MKMHILKYLSLAIMASFLVSGCTQQGTKATTTAVKPVVTKEAQTPKGPSYAGKVVGKSDKAKQISIEVGKDAEAKTIMVSFDDKTKGLEHAATGEAAIIAYEMRDGIPFATVIKPKLATLPPGVTNITPEEVNNLIVGEKDFLLVDSRPGTRYSESHLPGAISIPVCEMQELLQNLPQNKEKLLVFYCGGPT